jgi:PelA/Pel-15E family pectate lyase
LDTKARPFSGDPNTLKGTFDNRATTGELRFLARAFRATGNPRYKQAFIKGLDHILEAQYPSGGWPQSYPPSRGYQRHITFNDETMVLLMRLLRDVATSKDYAFIDTNRRKAAQASFERGIECILKCQIVVNRKLTAWCAQHDEIDYSPRPARSYELVSLSGEESVGIIQLLMSIDNPSPEIIRAVKAGADWFERSKLIGIRQVKINGDKVIIEDPNAPPLWARFYEIDTNGPFFCGRDGVKKYKLSEIEFERRDDYAWYGQWWQQLAADDYVLWKEKWLK